MFSRASRSFRSQRQPLGLAPANRAIAVIEQLESRLRHRPLLHDPFYGCPATGDKRRLSLLERTYEYRRLILLQNLSTSPQISRHSERSDESGWNGDRGQILRCAQNDALRRSSRNREVICGQVLACSLSTCIADIVVLHCYRSERSGTVDLASGGWIVYRETCQTSCHSPPRSVMSFAPPAAAVAADSARAAGSAARQRAVRSDIPAPSAACAVDAPAARVRTRAVSVRFLGMAGFGRFWPDLAAFWPLFAGHGGFGLLGRFG